MSTYNGDLSVPSDKELILWGWTTNQISQLRLLAPELQRTVLDEYIRKFMEEGDLDNPDF